MTKKLSFDLSALTAAYAAKGGEVKKIETGQRNFTENEIYKKSSGVEPEVIKNFVFEVLLQGEEGREFAVEIKAKSMAAAEAQIMENYPESLLLNIGYAGERNYRLQQQAANARDF